MKKMINFDTKEDIMKLVILEEKMTEYIVFFNL